MQLLQLLYLQMSQQLECSQKRQLSKSAFSKELQISIKTPTVQKNGLKEKKFITKAINQQNTLKVFIYPKIPL